VRKPSGIIALLTDFGLDDVYVGVMKGVIHSINPAARVVDLTHGIPSFDVNAGSIALWSAYRYFPPGSIFVCVVDPGVGSGRRAIAAASTNYYFIGPDNGLVTLAAMEDGLEMAVELRNDRYFLKPVSRTFHGRDIFAPAAAWITRGVKLSELGPALDPKSLAMPPVGIGFRRERGGVLARAVYIDKFGNVWLSVRFEGLLGELGVGYGDEVLVSAGDRSAMARVCGTFSEVGRGEYAVYENSFGLAEVGMFLGSAARALGVEEGCEVLISRPQR